jgi:hypothetical protein
MWLRDNGSRHPVGGWDGVAKQLDIQKRRFTIKASRANAKYEAVDRDGAR